VPQATKGREAHPPKVFKVWKEKINRKEWLKAFMSAVAATADKAVVLSRGHRIDGVKNMPIIVDDGVQGMKKTSEVRKMLLSLGLEAELERASETKTRPGRGKSRGRAVKVRKGPLIVVAEDKGIVKSAAGIRGVDAVRLADLCVSDIAPGSKPGRVTVWAKSAIEALEKGK
jgi:large subunit ribosomal protein L4e